MLSSHNGRQDYVLNLEHRFVALYGDEAGREHHRVYLTEAIGRLQNRLGGDRYQKLKTLMEAAFREHAATGDLTLHRVGIQTLLEQYYDPMYEYQLTKRQDRVVFRGNCEAVTEWATQNCLAKAV